MSLISSINIAQQALSVNQSAITTVSNNIANVDTPGYSKLRVDQAAVVNWTASAGSAISQAEACSGVTVANVTRYSDWFLQNYSWQEGTTGAYLTQASSTASNVQDLVNELKTTGLSSALGNFYNAANAVSNAPNDITARQNYVDAASSVCSVFNSINGNLDDIKKSLVGSGSPDGTLESSEVSSQIDKVNGLLDQLADVNFGIIKTNNGDTSSSSLLDQRDALISQLTALMPASVVQNPNGTVNIAIGDTDLLKGNTVKGHLSAVETGNADNPVKISIVDPKNPATIIASDVTSEINNGSIGAILDICGSDTTKFTISGVLKSLDTMASGFAGVLNKIQTSTNYPSGTNTPMCMTSDGKNLQVSGPNNYLFVNKSAAGLSANGITAANIAVNSAVVADPYKIAVARVDTAEVGNTDEVGNNSNMALVMDARNDSNYYSTLGGTTLEQYLANMTSTVGAKVQDIDGRLTNQNLVLTTVKNNLQSKMGVNLDEELTDLIKYQRAYQSAAKIFNICNSLLEELVHLGQ